MIEGIRSWWNRRWIERDLRSKRIAHAVTHEVVYTIFADLSVEVLKEVVDLAKKNRETKGHSDYTSLADLYVSIMKNDEI